MDQIGAPWSPEEDEMLLNLVQKHGTDWSLISKSIPGRSTWSCWSRWLLLQESFTPEEDEMLLNLVQKHGRNWSLISMSIPGKLAISCWSRWLSLQESFTPEEDEMLLNLVEKHGPNWSLIGKSILGISDRSCRIRWLSLQMSFTPEEDEMLQNLVEKHGPNWSLISKSIPGRSAWSCCSRWLYYHRPLFMPEDQTNEDTTITGSQNSIYEGNSSHEVGGVVSGQAPSISDMARGNMSSGGTRSYSRDHSPPSWNALYKRDSSPMIIESDSVQQFVGSEFGWNDFSEDLSKA